MKNTIVLLVGLFLIFSLPNCKRDGAQNSLYEENTISVLCSPGLYKVTSEWASEFCNLNPGVNIKVVNVTGPKAVENMDYSSKLGFVMGENDPVMQGESSWKVVVGRDVIVPVYNSENPFKDLIKQKGISPEVFAAMIKDPGMKNWGTILDNGQNIPAALYLIDDPSVNSGVARLVDAGQVEINGTRVKDGRELIASVQNDRYSIGICKMTSLFDAGESGKMEGIGILPIDRNGNGKVDYMEDIYDDLGVLSRGVQIGKYPRAMSSNIYSVSDSKPTNRLEVEFLKWVLTYGQEVLINNGYNDLVYNERLAKVSMLEGYEIQESTSDNYAVARNPIYFYIYFPLALALIAGLVLGSISGLDWLKKRNAVFHESGLTTNYIFSEDFVKSPPGLYYDKTHTWAFMEKEGLVKVGIDDFLQHITGPLTRVKTKEPGERIGKGKHILSIIQEGKQLDIYSPLSGTIKEINKDLDTNTSIINSSPYTEGWIYKIEPTNWLKEIQFFIMGNRYKEWLKSEFSRFKEFLTESVRPETLAYAHVLQDGGELKDGVLMDLGPEVWEDFQTNFIDVSS